MWAERLEVGENMLKNPHELAIGEVESKKEEIDNYFLRSFAL